MELVLMCLLGIMLGVVIGQKLRKENPIGTLRIDRSDPDDPYLFVELYEPINDLSKRQEVIFDVKNEDFIPRK